MAESGEDRAAQAAAAGGVGRRCSRSSTAPATRSTIPQLYPPPPSRSQSRRGLSLSARLPLRRHRARVRRSALPLLPPRDPADRQGHDRQRRRDLPRAPRIDGGAHLPRHRSGRRITGTGAATAAGAAGRKAPQYVIFEATTAYAGDTGQLAELSPAVRTNTGTLDSSKLAVDAGRHLRDPPRARRPRVTREFHPADGLVRSADMEHTAQYLILRELFHDWEREDALDLRSCRVDDATAHTRGRSTPRAACQLRRVGEIVNNQMRFWNEFYAVVLETYADMNGDGKRFMPRNDLNAPNFAVDPDRRRPEHQSLCGRRVRARRRRGARHRGARPRPARLQRLPPRPTSGANRSTTPITSPASTPTRPRRTPTARCVSSSPTATPACPTGSTPPDCPRASWRCAGPTRQARPVAHRDGDKGWVRCHPRSLASRRPHGIPSRTARTDPASGRSTCSAATGSTDPDIGISFAGT